MTALTGFGGDFSNRHMYKQKTEMAKQDEHLDMLLESVKRISLTSKRIADELETQNVYVLTWVLCPLACAAPLCVSPL